MVDKRMRLVEHLEEPRRRILISLAAFAFFAVIPWALKFLINFAGPEVLPLLTISKYISFVTVLLLMFGLVFELPIVIILLIFIISAILTPTPDAFTQTLMAIPLVFLYEVSIWLSKLVLPTKGSD